MKRVIIASLAIVAMVGCTKEKSSSEVASNIEAIFEQARIESRTSGDDWEALDQVGIFMFKNGETLATYALAKSNVLHVCDAVGNFTTGEGVEPIYYPQSDAVDFYAYYPYSAETETYYTADITAQNVDGGFDQGAVDFLTASVTNKSKSSEAVSFTFDHRLAMLSLVITPSNTIADLKSVEVTVSQINTQATFNPLTGALVESKDVVGSVQLQTTATTTDTNGNVTELTATAIMLPESLASTAMITFKVSDTESYTTTFPSGASLAAGKNHTYNVVLGYDEPLFSGAIVSGWGESSMGDLFVE